MTKILKQGAEAVIYSDEIDGQEVLVKERIRKRYRLDQIDKRLRKERTRQEMKLMREARGNGVSTPRIISSDEASFKIVMENIAGVLVRDFFERPRDLKTVCQEIGKDIGKLHASGIIHGDLTTSNMILKEGKVYFIDFGLGQFSKRIEDMATDLSVLEESMRATHHKIYPRYWKEIVLGYKSANKLYGQVLDRMEEIESRARYRPKPS